MKPDGTSVRLSDREVVANIPNPSPDSPLDAAAISELVKLCDLQAIRQPKHAGLIKMTGDLWKRELEKIKPEPTPTEQATPQAAPAATAPPPATAATKPATEAETAEVAKQVKEIKRLVDLKKWQELAALCQGLANSTEEELRQFADMGSQLSSALESLAAARKKEPQATAEAARIRRNADVTGRPNPLRPGDNSGMERAQAMRSEADAIEERVKTAIKEAEGRISDLASLIDRTAQNNGRIESSSETTVLDVETAKKYALPKTPSLEFKGFSLNLSKAELLEVLQKRAPAESITEEDDVDSEVILGKIVGFDRTRFYINNEKVCIAVWEPGTDRGYMRSLVLTDPFVSDLFDSHGLDFKSFLEEFITAYGGPWSMNKMPFRPIDSEYSGGWEADYDSKIGWILNVKEHQDYGMTIRLQRTRTRAKTNFGD